MRESTLSIAHPRCIGDQAAAGASPSLKSTSLGIVVSSGAQVDERGGSASSSVLAPSVSDVSVLAALLLDVRRSSSSPPPPSTLPSAAAAEAAAGAGVEAGDP